MFTFIVILPRNPSNKVGKYKRLRGVIFIVLPVNQISLLTFASLYGGYRILLKELQTGHFNQFVSLLILVGRLYVP